MDNRPTTSSTTQTTNVTSELFGGQGEKSTYPFNEVHNMEWNANSNNYSTDSAFARAWARLMDRGIVIGPPQSGEFATIDPEMLQQNFLHARGLLDTDEKRNPNASVEFFDARGIVGTESGL